MNAASKCHLTERRVCNSTMVPLHFEIHGFHGHSCHPFFYTIPQSLVSSKGHALVSKCRIQNQSRDRMEGDRAAGGEAVLQMLGPQTEKTKPWPKWAWKAEGEISWFLPSSQCVTDPYWSEVSAYKLAKNLEAVVYGNQLPPM